MRKQIFLICALGALLGSACSASSTKLLPPIPTPYTTLTPPPSPDHFTFVVGGDNRSTGHGYPMPPPLEQICREIGLLHPAFVFWGGDVIEGYGDTPAEANGEYDVFLRDASLTGVPFFNAPGNHEFSLDPSLEPIYEKRMGKLYGSFDYGNSHFIALNTSPVGADGTITSGTLDEPQWAWLEEDLKANGSAKNIFVSLHHFVFGPPDEDTPTLDTGWKSVADRDRLHALMVKYHVRAVFGSHNHIYWHTVKDGVDYFISGGGGAPLDASPEQGGYLHYLLMTVDGTSVKTQILQPWHLEVDYPEGDGNAASTERAWVANTNRVPLTAGHLVLHLAALPVGHPLFVTAGITYKGKTQSGAAQIISVTPSADRKTVEVAVRVGLPRDRTTQVIVAPGPPPALK